jgi:hypothetical protein
MNGYNYIYIYVYMFFFLLNRPLMKSSPFQWNRLKICLLGDFDMLNSNLTSKTFEFTTQTSKLRKTTSLFFFNPFAGLLTC